MSFSLQVYFLQDFLLLCLSGCFWLGDSVLVFTGVEIVCFSLLSFSATGSAELSDSLS